MSEYPFDDFSPREIATSLVPKPNVDEAGLPSDNGVGNSFGDTVGMMIPDRGSSRGGARTIGLMIDPPVGDSLAGDGTRGMMPKEPHGHIECSFPMADEQPEKEVPIRPGSAQLAPGARKAKVSLGMNPAADKSVTLHRRVESVNSQLKIGAKIEKEHGPSKKKALKTAKDHVKENPNYYPASPKPKGAGEKLVWTSKVPKPPKE